jgi:uncharacterized protein YbbC (DUF1343 family)
MFNKYAGAHCNGLQIHVTDRYSFRPLLFTLSMLAAVNRIQPDMMTWNDPPYEYEFERLPADLIIGNRVVRDAVESGTHPEDILYLISDDEKSFLDLRREFLLYD